MKKLMFFLQCTRAYALPMSVMAWLIPFSMGVLNKGNILYGLVALLGICCVHLGANLFDDVIDYKKYLKDTEKNGKINLKKGKCKYFVDGSISIKKALLICGFLFLVAILIGAFFITIYKLPIIILMAITGILCLLYPKSGYFGLSEIIVGLIYSPLLFTGVYYVMTSNISTKLEWLSISFAVVTVTLLYTDFFLDYNTDKISGKKTIPVICGNKQNAYYFYLFLIFLIYSNIFLGIHAHVFSLKYLIIFISIFPALKTASNLQHYVDKEIKDEKEFLKIMNTVQKYIAIFTCLCILSFL